MIATALGIRWKLGPPYRSGIDSAGEYVPTPPGASMHFEYDLETGALDLSYLYPVYPLDDTDVDFSLKKAPLVFYPELNSMEGLVKVSQKGLSTLISPTKHSDKSASLEALRKRLLSTLDEFPEATKCYYTASNQSYYIGLEKKRYSSLVSSDSKLDSIYTLPILLVMLLL